MASPVKTFSDPLVKLKDGSQVPKPMLQATTNSIKMLAHNNFLAFYDLVAKCRDSDYQLPPVAPFGLEPSAILFKKLGYMDSQGRINNMIEAIVLNSTEGEGSHIKLVDPVKHKK